MKDIADSHRSDNSATAEHVEIAATVVTSEGILTKTYGIGADAKPVKFAEPRLSRGTVRRLSLSGTASTILETLGREIEAFKQTQALVAAPPPAGRAEWALTTKGKADRSSGTIARTKRDFQALPSTPGLLFLDFDTKHFPDAVRNRMKSESESLSAVLARVFPGFEDAAYLMRPSVSVGIRNREGGHETNPNGGQHRFYVARDGSDAEDFARRLAERLTLAGFGWCDVSTAGTPLHRTLIDYAASEPSRLIFEAPAHLASPELEHIPHRRDAKRLGGTGTLDTRALEPLTADESARLDEVRKENEAAVKATCDATREAWRQRRVAEGADEEAVDDVLDAGRLSPDWTVHLDDGRVVSVSDILAAPQDFHERTCADPVEWDYGSGRNLAVIYTDGTPNVTTLAHGGKVYYLDLDLDPRRFFTPIAEAPRRPALRRVTGLIDASRIPRREWLLRPRLPRGDVVQCVGEPSASKSTFALREALLVASGDPKRFGETALHRSGPVIVYNAEDRLDEMERRLAAAQRFHGLTDLRHEIVLWSGVTHGTLTIVARDRRNGGPLRRADGAERLEEMLAETKPALVVLDPQVDLARGASENDNDDMNALLQELGGIAAQHGVCILVIHHTAKSTRQSAGDIGAGRGAFAAVGKVRVAFTMCPVTGKEEEENAWLAAAGEGRLVRLDYSKVSHDRKPSEPIVFRILSAPVGNGSGDAVGSTECLFDPATTLALEGDEAAVLELVDHRALSARAVAKPRDDAKAQAIARLVLRSMDGETRARLTDIWSACGAAMRNAKLTTAMGRPTLSGEIRNALVGGIVVETNGQNVRLSITKDGRGDRAPLVVEAVPADVD